jgi:hypothetical protein
MDVRDLQLLDWLIWDDIAPCQVTAIGCDYIETTKCGITLAESHLLSPITLTAGVLEKNGFRKENYIEVVGGLDTYYLGEEIGSFRIHRLQKGYYQFGLAKIKYVHQLQHALRLCGINKEIEL